MIAGRPAATIALYHRRQVQPVDHLDDKPREMPLGKPFIERRRKQKPRRTVKLPEIAHQAHPAGESICAIIPGASIRQVRQAARKRNGANSQSGPRIGWRVVAPDDGADPGLVSRRRPLSGEAGPLHLTTDMEAANPGRRRLWLKTAPCPTKPARYELQRALLKPGSPDFLARSLVLKC